MGRKTTPTTVCDAERRKWPSDLIEKQRNVVAGGVSMSLNDNDGGKEENKDWTDGWRVSELWTGLKIKFR